MSNGSWSRIKSGLHLDKRNGWIGGVCAGLANTFSVDPNFVRVGVVIAGLFLGKYVVAAYLIAWLVLDNR